MPFGPKANILLVDDLPSNLLALETVLEGLGLNLVKARSGREALRYLLDDDFAVILMDVQMPEMDGFETAVLIRGRDRSRHTPIIFLTAFSRSDQQVFQGYSLGAVDYLVKPIVPEVLRSKVAVFVELFQKTEQVKHQAELLRENQRREHERALAEEKGRWELERLRQEAAREKKNAEELARIVTERVHAEAALRQAEEKYRGIFENAIEGIFQSTREGRFLTANPTMARILGFRSAEELVAGVPDIGQQLHVDPGRRHEFARLLEAQGLVQGFECQVYRKDRRVIWISLSARAVRDAGGTVLYYQGFAEDITQRKQAEQALQQAEQALSRSAEELRIAGEIQQGLFPRAMPKLAGYDIAGASWPAQAAGGDYVDFLPMPQGRLGIVIGDVSGHGLGPALIAASTRAYLRAFASTHAEVSQILTDLNRLLIGDVADGRFVTLLLARLDPATRCLSYASAGHPAGCVLDGTGTVKRLLRSTAMPLGIEPTIDFPVSPVMLEPGDLVLLLTDGVIEATSSDDKVFGIDRALEAVRAHCGEPAQAIVTALHQAVEDFARGFPQRDDLSVIVLKVASSPTGG